MGDVNPTKSENSFSRLQSMGVTVWEQVLLMLPAGFNDFTKMHNSFPLDTLYPVAKCCYWLTVESAPNKKGVAPPRVELMVSDGTCRALLTAFGDTWQWEGVKVGQRIAVECVLDVYNGYLQVKNPVLIPFSQAGMLVPTYRGKRGANKSKTISPDFVFGKTREALSNHLEKTADFILSHFAALDEESLLRRSGIRFDSLISMLRAIHAPSTLQQSEDGMAAARSLCAFEIIFNAHMQMLRKPCLKSVINVKDEDVEKLIRKFPHELTGDQKRTIQEIVNDLRRPYAMRRLLSGDVGFGKTDAAIIPAIAAHLAGAKVAIITPSSLIAAQWVEKLKGYGKSIPFQEVYGPNKIDDEILKLNPIMIGTVALVTRLPKINWEPSLVIFDEQQKQGKNHKDSLVSNITNRLDATATCLPQTGALVLYGGMDESILNKSPVEKRIQSRIVQHTERERLFSHLKQVIEKIPDAQFAVIYPNVSSGQDKSSLMFAAEAWEKQFPGKVGVLYGALPATEKTRIIKMMIAGEIKVLLSTVLIETGITLPSLRGLIVVGADRFGVSALHQLRGRLSRFGGVGYFYMYLPSPDVSDETYARLELLTQYNDGFVLAEKDAEMRGYGSFLDGETNQSGKSKSALFSGVNLMPKDITSIIERGKSFSL